MGQPPLTGSWVAKNTSGNANDYVGALKWGTGINPVHLNKWEGPPLRTTGREPGPDDPSERPGEVPGELVGHELWGYSAEDIAPLTGMFTPGTPPWETETDTLRANNYSGMPDWGTIPEDPKRTDFQQTPELATSLWKGIMVKSFPTETVSEGWLNKETGQINNAHTSDPAQYERQTSMQQVNPVAGRNNDAATLRGTDDPRFNITTRLVGMKEKPWSQGERNEDMFPFQQMLGVRPFWYRTAATGNPAQMAPNEMYVSDPIERVVPPDPDLGSPETEIDGDYGYTTEDMTYG